MTFGKFRINGSFVLLWAVLLYVDAGKLLFPVWCCAMLHELGHWLPLRLLGGRVECWDFNAGGVSMVMSSDNKLSYPAEIFCTLAGPLASFLCALFFAHTDDIILWCGICVVQGLFNLLPAMGMDGGRALYLTLQWAGIAHAARAMRVISLITALCLSTAGAVVFVRSGYNPTLLLTGLYIAVSAFGRIRDD